MSNSGTEVSHHPQYYFDDGSHVFRVENTLYKLSRTNLSRHSHVFADMFGAGKTQSGSEGTAAVVAGSNTEGASDDQPILLPDLSASTFDLFLEHHFGYPRLQSRYTKEELARFIAFCDKYHCPQTKAFVVHRLQAASWRFHPAELIQLAVTYNAPGLFHLAFKELMDISVTQLSKLHRAMMGIEVFTAFVLAKTVLDDHCRIIAAEEPRIMTHAEDCQDPAACEEDWHAVWWNGMGRFLLDGRNPQPYGEAVKRFKEMHFGRVGEGCKDSMFRFIGQGTAFEFAEHFVNELCDHLVRQLLFEPSSPM
ncbi:hypothetical protein HYDPIDRAFT_33029 [Hydnomerulius pinastri MD-312]|uniref:Unplaced genomic scaffold scaffold_50, whole genome shotgun sequence n=1 Tax=Hydnomerulius pinastri MD-312 TaxID=994086 RepID=A0A0C9V2V1_9AGAM|nr:hypothetical protein HYDPIDRAFT_33029 [Hydnomerulius pinastri MD-312]